MHPDTFLRSKLVHAAVAITALIWLFEFVPPPKPITDVNGVKAGSLPPHLMVIAAVRDSATAAMAKLPSWFGLWNVYEPAGTFHPLAPAGEVIRDEALAISKFVRSLQKRTFFRIFKVDLSRECPFWARQDLCSSPEGSCHVCECSEDEIPKAWLQKPTEHFVSKEESDQVTPWLDQRSSLLGDVGAAENDFLESLSGAGTETTSYVDLVRNPPGFTAYKGRNIWQLIYRDNCIRDTEREVFDPNDAAFAPACSDEDVYERMISGLQTTIMVLASEFNKPYNGRSPMPLLTVPAQSSIVANDFPARYQYNLDMYRWRVNTQPRWVDNMYLDFSILLRTLGRLSPIVSNCGCYTGTDADDSETHQLLTRLLDYVRDGTESGTPKYTQMPIFTRKQDLAIRQINNVSRIFDCIECEKCRLHGKVKLTALQVAIKSLPSPSYQPITSLERNELCALVNALGYFSEAIAITHRMKSRILALRRLLITALIWVGVALWKFAMHHRSRLAEKAELAPATTASSTPNEASKVRKPAQASGR